MTARLRSLAMVAALALVAGGCGSALSRSQLAATNGTRDRGTDAARQPSTSDERDAGDGGTAGGTATAVEGNAAGGSTPAGVARAANGTGNVTVGATGAVRGSGKPIVLGSVGVAGGPIGATVAAAPDGARAWVAAVNERGGLNGHPVKLIVADDGADASRAASIVRRMVDEQGVVALFATYAPTTLQAAMPFLEQRGVPVIGGVSGNFAEENSPMVFNPQAGPSIVPVASAASIGAQLPPDQRDVGVFYCFESEQCAFIRDGLVKRAGEFGVRIVYQAQVSLAQPDFTAQVAQARAAGAKVLFGAFDLNTLLRLASAAHRQGWNPVFAGAFQFDTDDIKPYAKELNGLLGFSLTVNYDASQLLEEYRQAVRRFVPGGKIGGLGAQAWAQGRLLEAASPFLSPSVTSRSIIDALYKLKAVDLGGLVPPVTFNKGAHRDVNHCYVPTVFASGRWTEPLGERFRCVRY